MRGLCGRQQSWKYLEKICFSFLLTKSSLLGPSFRRAVRNWERERDAGETERERERSYQMEIGSNGRRGALSLRFVGGKREDQPLHQTRQQTSTVSATVCQSRCHGNHQACQVVGVSVAANKVR